MIDSLLFHFDGRKVANTSGKIPGKKCGGSYISASFKCKSHKKGGKLTAEGKTAARELAAKIRNRRGLKPNIKGTKDQWGEGTKIFRVDPDPSVGTVRATITGTRKAGDGNTYVEITTSKGFKKWELQRTLVSREWQTEATAT